MRRTAVITGATSGIGLELAAISAQNGYRLILLGRSRDKLLAAAAVIKNLTPSAEIELLAGNLAKESDVRELCQALSTKRIDFFVNNAGFGVTGEFLQTDMDKEAEMAAVNMVALTRFCKTAAINMKRQGRGIILNIASIAGVFPTPGSAVYGATKAYVLSLSQALHEELSPFGVSVTALCPGPTGTNFGARSKMGDTPSFSKGVMSAHKTALCGFRAAHAKKRVAVVGAKNKATTFMSRHFPMPLVLKMVKRQLSLKAQGENF